MHASAVIGRPIRSLRATSQGASPRPIRPLVVSCRPLYGAFRAAPVRSAFLRHWVVPDEDDDDDDEVRERGVRAGQQ